MKSVKRIIVSVLSVLAFASMTFAANLNEVERKVQDKVRIDQFSVKEDGNKFILEGRAPLLQDKNQAERIARKEIGKKQELVNNIIVDTSEKTDENITLDVIAQIKRDSPQNFVFDDLNVVTKGGNVTLIGRVRNAYLFEISEDAAAKTTGVRSVTNNIEILPPSLSDDRVRANVLKKLRNDDRLFYYFLGSQPSIQIIVQGSRVTLAGFVDTETDRILAGTLVRQMSGVLSVDNQLQVD